MNCDTIILGAGPAGLWAATQCAILGIKTIILERLSTIGGQCSLLYPEKKVNDIPGSYMIKGQNLIDNLTQQIREQNIKIFLNCNDYKIINDLNSNRFIIDKLEERICSKYLIIATGGGRMRPRELQIANAIKYKDKQILYKIGDKNLFKEKNIIITGGGSSAINWAQELSQIANVTLVHKSEVFRETPGLEQFKKDNESSIYTSFIIKELVENNNKIDSVIIESIITAQLVTLKCDYLLVFYGLLPEFSDFSQTVQLETNESGKIITSILDNKTSTKNAYAIGDAATHNIPKVKKNLLSAFFEGSQTAYSIYSDMKKNPI